MHMKSKSIPRDDGGFPRKVLSLRIWIEECNRMKILYVGNIICSNPGLPVTDSVTWNRRSERFDTSKMSLFPLQNTNLHPKLAGNCVSYATRYVELNESNITLQTPGRQVENNQ